VTIISVITGFSLKVLLTRNFDWADEFSGGSGALIHEDYLDLMKASTVLFHPFRMIIMQTLSFHGSAEYRELRNSIPEMTDGNLASHLRVLEGCGYIRCHKEIVGRKLRTSYELTEEGRKSFAEMKISLRRLVLDESAV